jgi:hypothetical protein
MVTRLSFLHSQNAQSLITVTESGMSYCTSRLEAG